MEKYKIDYSKGRAEQFQTVNGQNRIGYYKIFIDNKGVHIVRPNVGIVYMTPENSEVI